MPAQRRRSKRSDLTGSSFQEHGTSSQRTRIGHLIRRLVPAPHLVIGDTRQPYILRWHLVPENRFCNLFLHCILKDDEDTVLHDHPWWFLTLLFKGAYRDITFASPAVPCDSLRAWAADTVSRIRTAPAFALHRARYAHRIEIVDGPAWTLVVTGAVRRNWGFYRAKGWQAAGRPTDVSNRN